MSKQLVAAGVVSSGTGTMTPALPAGIASGDVLLLFVETANQAVSITNQNGGTWAAVTGSLQGTGTAGGTSATRLTVFGLGIMEPRVRRRFPIPATSNLPVWSPFAAL